tara:strand:- start:73 stop:402 length:330 start_codon:yes stop_codon:yes gene_type:complete
MSLKTKIELIETDSETISANKHLFFDMTESLSEYADWADAMWDFEGDELATYADNITALFDLSEEGVSFSVVWAGDAVRETIELSIDELATVIQENEIRNFTKYIVHKE